MNQSFDNNRRQPDSIYPEPAPAPQRIRVAVPEIAPYMTYGITAVTVFVYILQMASQYLYQVDIPAALFVKSNALIQAGQLWRLITPVLLHGSIMHIGFNMYALLSFGTGLERYFGHGRFLLLYLLGAFAGNVASFLLTPANSLGASTAIFGLLGAEGIFLYQNRKLFAGRFQNAIGNIIFIAAINLFFGFSSSNIDNAGHIGGLIGGLMFTWFAGPIFTVEGIPPVLHFVDQRTTRDVLVGAATVVLVFGALAMWGMIR